MLQARRCHVKSAGEKFCRWEGAIANLAAKHIAKVPSQICRYMCCLASCYPSPSFKSNIFASGWILGSGLVSLKIYSIWGGLRCGWILGSGDVSMNIYSIWGGLRCGLLLGSCGYSIWGGLRCGLLLGPCGFRRCFHENLQHLKLILSLGINILCSHSGIPGQTLSWRRSGVGDCPGVLSCNLGISSLTMFRLQCMFRLQFWDGAFLIQDFSPAVSGWRLLSSRCFTCGFGMPP